VGWGGEDVVGSGGGRKTTGGRGMRGGGGGGEKKKRGGGRMVGDHPQHHCRNGLAAWPDRRLCREGTHATM